MARNSWLAEKENNKSSSDRFLRVKPGCKLRIRLIDDPVKVVRIFSNDRKCASLKNEDVGERLKSKYPSKLSSVSVRYACWCIDRDDKKMKILDMPASVARKFGNREALVGKGIAGDFDGCDWAGTTNGTQGKDVRYEAIYIEETPLSCAERQMVDEHKSGEYGNYDLTKIYKSYDFEEAENKLWL